MTIAKAPRNRTLTLEPDEKRRYRDSLLTLHESTALEPLLDRILFQDTFSALPFLPPASVDLLVADPPYNLNKTFGAIKRKRMTPEAYEEWFESWLALALPLLKPTASIYVCGNWRSSSTIQRVLERQFVIRNRITWEREKGRGAKRNWKSTAEDIWFATVGKEYVFNLEDVKLKRKVIAPYRQNGEPRGWEAGEDGNYRLTHPSNMWTDLTVPFWSMPENTPHPTQKPEKALAKLILASSNEGDVILDPFLGSGTTAVVARKLKRHFIGIEVDENYCCVAQKRLERALDDSRIQGYSDGVFWERNAAPKG